MATIDYKQKMNKVQVGLFLSFMVLFFIWLGWPSENAPVPPKALDFETVEFKLLTLDRGHPISVADQDIPRVGHYLTELSQKYQMPREQIADITWSAKKYLINSGVRNETVLTLLSTLNKISAGKDPNFFKNSYATVVSMYIVEREKNHVK